jgi:hypothetical protein
MRRPVGFLIRLLPVVVASACTSVDADRPAPPPTGDPGAGDAGANPTPGEEPGFGETPPREPHPEPEPPPGWRTVANVPWSCNLFAPASERVAPSPPVWVERACEAPLPSGARCRYLDASWPKTIGAQVRPAQMQPFTVAVSNDEGRPARWLFALPLDDDGGRGRLVFDGDVDGTPRFMLRSRGDCDLRGAVDSARFTLSVRGWLLHFGAVTVSVGGTHEAGFAFDRLPIDRHAWAMPSELGTVERLPQRLAVVPGEGSEAHRLFAGGEGRAYREASVVAARNRVFFEVSEAGRRRVYVSSDRAEGGRLLPFDDEAGTDAAAFGTDGKDAFWLEGEGATDDGSYASIHAVGGSLGSGLDGLAASTRRIVHLGAGRIGDEPTVVGCGMAATSVATPSTARRRVTIVRMADGTKLGGAADEGARLPYVRPIALSCSELFATIVQEEEPALADLRVPMRRETIVRIALSELGSFR